MVTSITIEAYQKKGENCNYFTFSWDPSWLSCEIAVSNVKRHYTIPSIFIDTGRDYQSTIFYPLAPPQSFESINKHYSYYPFEIQFSGGARTTAVQQKQTKSCDTEMARCLKTNPKEERQIHSLGLPLSRLYRIRKIQVCLCLR